MKKAVVWDNENGSVSIMHLEEGAGPEQAAGRIPDGVTPTLIDHQDIPEDRTFRDAWKSTPENQKMTLSVDMPKARNLWRNNVRNRRKPLLEALDIEYQQADEKGDASEKAKIAAKKKKLRDAPEDPRIEAAQTPEDLKLIDPLSGP